MKKKFGSFFGSIARCHTRCGLPASHMMLGLKVHCANVILSSLCNLIIYLGWWHYFLRKKKSQVDCLTYNTFKQQNGSWSEALIRPLPAPAFIVSFVWSATLFPALVTVCDDPDLWVLSVSDYFLWWISRKRIIDSKCIHICKPIVTDC